MDFSDLPEWSTRVLAIAGFVLVVCTVLVGAIQTALPRLEQWAAGTPDKRDDAIVAKLRRGVELAVIVLDVVQKALPRVTAGKSLRGQVR